MEADYPYTASETIKIKEVHHNFSETILPSPPPYQENDPLAHVHFKKFTKKKISSSPQPPSSPQPSSPQPAILALPPSSPQPTIGRKRIEDDSPTVRETSVSIPPKQNKLEKRNSFLNQVPTPTELPKLAFDFSFSSTPNLNETPGTPQSPALKSATSTQLLANDPPKPPSEKKSLLEYFGLKTGSKPESDALVKPKSEKKTVAPQKDKSVAVPVPPAVVTPAPIPSAEKPKVKKIRVLKATKKENVQKSAAAKNEGKTPINANESKPSGKEAQQQNDLHRPKEEILENRMEIDYFQKVKKSNRVPVIVKSPKLEPKHDEKQPKNEVFRHEETFSAANGPLKVKKKKAKSATIDTKPAEIINKDANQNIPSSPKTNYEAPIPKPRAILKLDGFDDDNRNTEVNQKPKKKVVLPALSSPSSPSDTEDSWNLVAKHRLNTRAITATAITVRKKSESDEAAGSAAMLQAKQLDILQKPKTMREMKREQQQQQQERVFNFGGTGDKDSDTEA